MSEFLLEFFSEEIPGRMQIKAAKNLEALLVKAFKAHRLSFDKIEVFYSAQRLGCVVSGLPVAQANFSEERKGPNKTAPEKAVQGFLTSVSLSIDQCEWRTTPKGEYLFATLFQKGLSTAEVLRDIILDIAKVFPWPKSMRWGSNKFKWIRPLHNILAIFDGKPIPGELDLESVTDKKAMLTFTTHSFGHRFLSPETFEVKNFESYLTQLKTHHVILKAEMRKANIISQISKICEDAELTLIEDEALLNEVNGLVEYPTAYLGKIESSFMNLPPEVLQTSMRENQKYFSLRDKKGNFAATFIVIANHLPKDQGADIIHGNQKVLSARLSDAAFFYEQDLKTDFTDYRASLKNLIFQEKLGSLFDKTARIQSLIQHFTKDNIAIEVAAHYKNDLATGMVGEFPDLQGIMGSYYAKQADYSDIAAQAIRDQYSPSGPNDTCPTSELSIQLGICDRIDTLVGFFGIGIKPTGSKDPFALRRATLSLIRLCVENKWPCDLEKLIESSIHIYKTHSIELSDIKNELRDFILSRFYIYLKDKNDRLDLLDSLFHKTDDLNLTDIFLKLETLQESKKLSEISTAYKRLNNMLMAESKKSTLELHKIKKDLLKDKKEVDLNKKLSEIHKNMLQNIEKKAFKKALENLSELTPYINAFLDDIHMNVDDHDLKTNRYALIQSACHTYQQFADFSKLTS